MKPTVFPEVLREGKGYRVTSGPGAHTDKLTRTITVPYGTDPSEEFTRLHELAHVKWTPTTDPESVAKRFGVTVDSLQAAEDCRIHLGLISRGAITRSESTLIGHKTPYVAYMLHRLVSYWSNPTAPFHDRLRSAVQVLVSMAPLERDYEILQGVIREIFKEQAHELTPFFASLPDALAAKFFSCAHAKYTAKGTRIQTFRGSRFDSFDEYQGQVRSHLRSNPRGDYGDDDDYFDRIEIPPFEKSVEVAAWIDQMLPPDGKPMSLPACFREDLTKRPPVTTLPQAHHPSFGDRDDGWGVMYYEVAPMNPLAHIVKMLNTKVPSDMGTRMRSLDRIISDSKVFERRKKLQGGTVLVDCSGSMGWEIEDLMTLLRAAPAATVALYAGTTCGNHTVLGTELPANSGVVRVVVHRGHIAGEQYCHFPFGGNVIDSPALQWLGTQAEPRIWVSDGNVTGCNESQPANFGLEVTMICRRSRITRLENLEDTLAAFKDLKLRRKIHGRDPYGGDN